MSCFRCHLNPYVAALSKSHNSGKHEAQSVLSSKDEWCCPVSARADSNSGDKMRLWSQAHFTYLFSVRNCQKIQQARTDDSPFILADGSVSVPDCSAASADWSQTSVRPKYLRTECPRTLKACFGFQTWQSSMCKRTGESGWMASRDGHVTPEQQRKRVMHLSS